MSKTAFLLLGGVLLFAAPGLRADSAASSPLLTQMSAANETPALSDGSTANVIVYVHMIRDVNNNITSGSVDFRVAAKFSGAVTVTGLHIHKAPAGSNGAIVIPTDINATDKSITVDSTGRTSIVKQVQFPQPGVVDTATIVDLLANPQNYYVNIHTTVNPGGAMRGQLLAASGTFFMGLMSTQNEVPAVNASGSAVASVFVVRALDSSGNVAMAAATFNLEYTGFDATSGTMFTGFHIHNAPAGVNGSVIINTGISGANPVPIDPSGSGNLFYEVLIAPSDTNFAAEVATVNGLFSNPAGYYINVHTDKFGGGIARDQLRAADAGVFQVSMLPSNETPPVTGLQASATSRAVVFTVRNTDGTVAAGTVLFDVNFRGFPAPTTVTGLHIHDGAAGVAGGVTISSGLSGTNTIVSDTGNGNVFKIVTVRTAAGINTLNTIVKDASQAYINLHTTVNPAGAIRDQLGRPPAKPAIQGVVDNNSTLMTAAPGSVISIYGTNLATYFTVALGGINGLTKLPATVNGVSVTIGGVSAPLYCVSPGQLNVQVPFEVAAGTQPLVVTTAGGSSAPVNINVAAAAPDVFLVDAASGLGAVVKMSDSSLITAANPATAGDSIVIYSTGLGQTVPAGLTTGSLVVAGATLNTVAVSVTIGGANATVVSSIATPGFAGLYQTMVQVPAGVTGSVPLVLKAGTASSTAVNLAVH